MLRGVPDIRARIHIHSDQTCFPTSGFRAKRTTKFRAMINFVRNIGGSVGIALVSTFITRGTQVRQSYLAANMQAGNLKFRKMIDGLAAGLRSQGLSPGQALHQAYGRAAIMMPATGRGTGLQGRSYPRWRFLWCALIPMTFLMRKGRPRSHREDPPMHSKWIVGVAAGGRLAITHRHAVS